MRYFRAVLAVCALAAFGVLVGEPAIASGGAIGTSDLNPWSLDGELLVDGGEGRAGQLRTLPCDDIHEAISAYNDPEWSGDPADPPPEAPDVWLTLPFSENEINTLLAYVDDEWTFTTVENCTIMHHDGIRAATAWLVEAVGNPGPIVIITAEGETTCEYGEVLISDAYYYWRFGEWVYGFGSNWEEIYGVVEGFEVRGDVVFDCLTIVTVHDDVVNVASAVPTVQVNHDPLAEGLTGIDTWLWYDFTRPGAVSELTLTETVDAYGRGWTLDANAWIDWIGWDVDCSVNCDYRGMLVDYDVSDIDHYLDFADGTHTPAAIYNGGTNADGEAAATHVYEAKGDFNLSTVTVWRGYYTFNGLTTLYAPVVVADSVAYNVVEIRSVLGEPES